MATQVTSPPPGSPSTSRHRRQATSAAPAAVGGSLGLGLSTGQCRALVIFGGMLCIAALNLFGRSDTMPEARNMRNARRLKGKFLQFSNANLCNEEKVLEKFRERVAGEVLCPGDRDFLPAIKIFNARNQKQPSIAVQPMTTTDVVNALELARQHRLKVSVKGGGHNPAGLAVVDGAMLIEMSKLRSVEIDEYSAGGALWADVYAALKEQDNSLAMVGGGCPQVGVVGLALTGGIGWLSRSYGLVADNLLGATIVFANGTVRRVSLESHPELLWGLRGGGGSNFGVVVSADLQLYRGQPTYFAGTWSVPILERSQLERYLHLFQEFTGNLTDDRLTVDMIVARQHYSVMVANVQVQWILMFNGPVAEGLLVSRPLLLRLASTLTVAQVCHHRMALCRQGGRVDAMFAEARSNLLSGKPFLQNHTFTSWSSAFGTPPTMQYYVMWKSAYVQSLLSSTVTRIATQFLERPPSAASSTIFNLQVEYLGGAMRREPEGSSAYPHRHQRMLLSVQGYVVFKSTSTMPEEEERQQHEYVQRFTQSMYEGMRGLRLGAYAGYADRELPGWEYKYYSEANYNRLKALKESVGGMEMFNTPQRVGWVADSRSAVAAPAAVSQQDTKRPEPHKHQLVLGDRKDAPGKRQGCLSNLPAPEAKQRFSWASMSCCPDWIIDLALAAATGGVSQGKVSHEHRLNGPEFLVVGGTSGLGNAVARMLASLGAVVTLAQRGVTAGCLQEAARSARDAGVPEDRFKCVSLDLSDYSSISSAVQQIKSTTRQLHGVVLSAATWGEYRMSAMAGGASTLLAVNVVSHLVLMRELIAADLMLRSNVNPFGASSRAAESRGDVPSHRRTTRVVLVGSGAAYLAEEDDVVNLMANKEWEGGLYPKDASDPSVRAYSASKAANVLVGSELASRLEGMVSVFVHMPSTSMRSNLTETITRPGGAEFQLSVQGTAEENAMGILALLVPTRGYEGKVGHVYGGCMDVSPGLQPLLVAAPWPPHFGAGSKLRCSVWRSVLRWAGQEVTGEDALQQEGGSSVAAQRLRAMLEALRAPSHGGCAEEAERVAVGQEQERVGGW
eukprot:CAMPEP_0117676692 /NCGR_PEP_ID=MMETSP0804-20121206/16333_1 /TAXON_ID=1074897 /ORGANISM="Tetraselmis astigmatica, Strain CCMP880" /LENGTH=1071 /DNA_ID=CAMNT_0005485897 /DNA_START=144 /DNA_END=3361 /DNA_ORIENTATION=-